MLLNLDGRAVAVVEAKRGSIDPLTAKEQARLRTNFKRESYLLK